MPKRKKENNKKRNVHTISLLVANKPGVLMRIAMVFARRGFNIDSLVVSPSVNPRFSRMTIVASGDVNILDQIIKQTRKLVDVIHITEHTPKDALAQELALFKIKFQSYKKGSLQSLLKQFAGKILDISEETIILELAGTSDELDEFEEKLKKFDIIEMIRSGKLLMGLGRETT